MLYDKVISIQERVLFTGFLLVYITVLLRDDNLDDSVWKCVSSSTIFLSFAARSSQVMANYKNDSTGQLAAGTVYITHFMALARGISVMIESDDFMYKL